MRYDPALDGLARCAYCAQELPEDMLHVPMSYPWIGFCDLECRTAWNELRAAEMATRAKHELFGGETDGTRDH